MRMVLVAGLAAAFGISTAFADPSGLYLASGIDQNNISYAGDVFVQPKGATMQLSWHLESGGKVVRAGSGTGVASGASIAAFCCGSVLYLWVQKGSDWIGVWSGEGDKGPNFGAEVLYRKSVPALPKAAPVSDDFLGRYIISGTNPDGTTYTGEVIVERDGKLLNIVRNAGGKRTTGSGLAFMNYLAVDYHHDSLAVYGPEQKGRLGTWVKWGTDQIGTERWAPAP